MCFVSSARNNMLNGNTFSQTGGVYSSWLCDDLPCVQPNFQGLIVGCKGLIRLGYLHGKSSLSPLTSAGTRVHPSVLPVIG